MTKEEKKTAPAATQTLTVAEAIAQLRIALKTARAEREPNTVDNLQDDGLSHDLRIKRLPG